MEVTSVSVLPPTKPQVGSPTRTRPRSRIPGRSGTGAGGHTPLGTCPGGTPGGTCAGVPGGVPVRGVRHTPRGTPCRGGTRYPGGYPGVLPDTPRGTCAGGYPGGYPVPVPHTPGGRGGC